MAVFTRVDQGQVESFLADYSCGALQSFTEIAEGTQNSNFHVFTDRARYVLTLFEANFPPDEIAFFLGFMNALNAAGIACPEVQRRWDGAFTGAIAGKTALLISFLSGQSIPKDSIAPSHCAALGTAVARMHREGSRFPLTKHNREGLPFLKALADKIRTRKAQTEALQPGLTEAIDAEFAWLEAHIPNDLPHGALHADIFPDNVFFEATRLTGIIDFYYACTATLVYDLAIVVSAWCFDVENQFRRERFDALIAAYQAVRPLEQREIDSFQAFSRAASMRFLMTRLHDWVFHDPANLVTPRDPLEYAGKLTFHQHHDLF
jgi:homoserine kinase type II